MAEQLHLQVRGPEDGTELKILTIERSSTGAGVKQQVQYLFLVNPDEQLLYFANRPEDKLVLLDDVESLAAQGVANDAQITVKRKLQNWTLPEGLASKENIERHGRLSYYHANRHDPDVPEELRIASGGEPVKLSTAEIDNVIMITQYTWADDGKSVKVYIDAQQEPRVVAAAWTDGQVNAEIDFQPRSFCLKVPDKTREFVLNIPKLYKEIVPSSSKIRVGQGKKITISLKKVEEGHEWFMLATKR